MSDSWQVSSSERAPCTLTLLSRSFEQTQQFARQLGALLQRGDLLLLDGNLGAGKTTFTQGVALGLGISTTVSSPTFTLLKEYTVQPDRVSTGRALYHFDLYRLDEPEEIFDLGFEDYFYGMMGVCVVEWANKANEFWPLDRLVIQLTTLSEDQRSLAFIATGAHYCELLQQFQKNTYVTASS